MNVIAAIARILLGLLFLAAGVIGFVNQTPPPMPGLAGQFLAAFTQSHWSLFVGAVQIVLGALQLVNRFVPLALIMLAAFLYNSFAFHITMLPSVLVLPVIVLALWFVVALQYRAVFAPLLQAKPGEVPGR